MNKNIILTWKNDDVPSYVIQKWKNLNPDFNIFFFNDDEIIKFLTEEYNESYSTFFKDIKFGRYKADFFRYCYLFKYGGYYFDIDIEPILPIREIVDDGIEFDPLNNAINYCTVLAMTEKHIFQAVLFSDANNPILKMCIDDMLYYGSNIGIDPPDIPPFDGHPTRCMYDNVLKYTNQKVLNEGVVSGGDQNILLGKEIKVDGRIVVRINGKIFGYSRYANYNRANGFN